MLIFYGFAKLNGAQFTVLSSELDKPLGDVAGFWLTWHYFGYSPVFGTLIGLGQVGIGLLLFWKRTALLGACLGLGVMVTISLIDMSYGVDPSGTLMALLTTAALGVVVLAHRADLVRVFWTDRLSGFTWRTAVAPVLVVVLAFGATWWVANVNNRAPTPIDGAWQVTSGSFPQVGAVDRVYFERNRAHLVVFRSGDRQVEHHVEVVRAQHELRVWRDWLRTDSPLVFTGGYELTGDRLVIIGTARVELTRIPNRG